jgi:hypothetical protein
MAGENHGAIQEAESVRGEVRIQVPVKMPVGIQDLQIRHVK